MRFALFYEIPVARPWDEQSELRAYQNTIEQAVAGDRFGWDAFWTVEHLTPRRLVEEMHGPAAG
ncbi:MAG: LLM class flavin-dependent oxidoreductase, partial [Acidimicrobiia bacterium]|nr:LLM class flavin-dependent oxidoreductase [Acidimicrobiia bacterium]